VREASGSGFSSDGSMDLIVRLGTRRIGGFDPPEDAQHAPYQNCSVVLSVI
jgi:hypothetical protein